MSPLMISKTKWMLLAVLVSMSMLIGCSRNGPGRFVTGRDYLTLKAGESYLAKQDETWASMAVIQVKDELIMDLIRANEKLVREANMLRSTH